MFCFCFYALLLQRKPQSPSCNLVAADTSHSKQEKSFPLLLLLFYVLLLSLFIFLCHVSHHTAHHVEILFSGQENSGLKSVERIPTASCLTSRHLAPRADTVLESECRSGETKALTVQPKDHGGDRGGAGLWGTLP